MEIIRPISDLRNNFREISKEVHEAGNTVYLTRNGYGDMVLMSMDAYQNLAFETEIFCKLEEAEREAELTNTRYDSRQVLKDLRAAIKAGNV